MHYFTVKQRLQRIILQQMRIYNALFCNNSHILKYCFCCNPLVNHG